MSKHPVIVARARGTVLVAVVIALFILSLVVASVVYAGARDQAQVGSSAQGLRATFAANSAADMAVKELMDNADRDGDGTIGAISNDNNSATDPVLGVTRAWATTTTSGSTTTITARAQNADAVRAVQVALNQTTAAPSVAGTVLLVVVNSASLSTPEVTRKNLIEGWGYTVVPISATDSQAAFNTACQTSSCAYVSESITSSNLGTKLTAATIPVISDEPGLADDLGFSSGFTDYTATSMYVTNNTHYITSVFPIGSLAILSSNQPMNYVSGTLGSFTTLSKQNATTGPSLVVLERGSAIYPSGTAAGRRVYIPIGGSGPAADMAALTADGKTMIKRAIEWCLLPVAYYKLDDASGTTAVDSIGGLNGTLTGPTWSAGNIGGGVLFNGSTDYLSIPDNSAFQVTQALTIAGWIKASTWPSDPNLASIILRKGEANPNNWELHVSAGKVTLALDDYDAYGFRGNTTLPLNTWQHVAATWDGSTVRIYLNGVLDNTPAARAAPIGTDTRAVYIGGRTGATDVVAGSVDDVRFYSRALTAAEVAALAAGSGKPKVSSWSAVSP